MAVFTVYETIAVAGFIYLVTFYSHFDLEVTVYLEITDILVAGIKDPMVMLMVAGGFFGGSTGLGYNLHSGTNERVVRQKV